MAKMPAITSSPVAKPIRQTSQPGIKGSAASRGGRRMTSASVGSKASASASVTAVTMLTHRICTGVIGSVSPAGWR
jgi:hypothetical protein